MKTKSPIQLSGQSVLVICVAALAMFFATGCAKRSGTGNGIALSRPTVVEVSCGECQFKMPGKGCDLAVRLEGRCYFVDGVHIDQLGDAHAADGFCNAIRKARVTGQIKEGRFLAASFELLPADGRRIP